MPIIQNPLLPPLLDRRTRERATTLGVLTGGNLYPNGTFLSLTQMCEPAQPTATDTLLYYQIRSTCKSTFPDFPTQPPILPALEHILKEDSGRKLITRLYKIMQHNSPITSPRAREAWNADLNITLTDKQWSLSCQQLKRLTANHRLRTIHFKYLHRIYRTPIQLHRMGLQTNSNCWKCDSPDAGFLHVAWHCPSIASYWSTTLGHISDITGLNIPHTPLSALLGILDNVLPKQSKLAGILLALAKRQVAIHWGSTQPPRVRDWVTNTSYCQTQLTYYWELQPSKQRPKDIWGPCITWLATHTLDN